MVLLFVICEENCPNTYLWILIEMITIIFVFFLVEESMESVDNPLHEAAKRGNVEFLKECLNNNVSMIC